MKYLEVNLNNKEFIKMLSEHIENNKPLSMTRFGDGEILFLKKALHPSLKKRMKQRWGVKTEEYEEVENKIINILNTSLRDSDVLGFMDLNNKVSKMLNCQPNKWLLLEKYLEEKGRVKDNLICDHQVCRSVELGVLKNLKKILKGRDLHIISSRTDILKNKNIDERLGCNIFYTDVPFNTTWREREKIMLKIDDIKENIVIESLGVLFKDVPSFLSNKGKICLDFGATIDAWSDIDSRPWFTNQQKYLKIK